MKTLVFNMNLGTFLNTAFIFHGDGTFDSYPIEGSENLAERISQLAFSKGAEKIILSGAGNCYCKPIKEEIELYTKTYYKNYNLEVEIA